MTTGSIPARTSPPPALRSTRRRRPKKRHIAAKLCLRPGHKVLDIGSGWGGLGLYLARNADVEVSGVDLVRRATQAISETRTGGGTRRPGRVSSARLPGGSGNLRPHRFGWYVRARRRTALSGVLRQGRQLASGRRRGAAPHDRRSGRAHVLQPLDSQIHFPRRLLPIAVRKSCRLSNAPVSG